MSSAGIRFNTTPIFELLSPVTVLVLTPTSYRFALNLMSLHFGIQRQLNIITTIHLLHSKGVKGVSGCSFARDPIQKAHSAPRPS